MVLLVFFLSIWCSKQKNILSERLRVSESSLDKVNIFGKWKNRPRMKILSKFLKLFTKENIFFGWFFASYSPLSAKVIAYIIQFANKFPIFNFAKHPCPKVINFLRRWLKFLLTKYFPDCSAFWLSNFFAFYDQNVSIFPLKETISCPF